VQAAILKTLSLKESDIVQDNLRHFKYSVGVFLRTAHGLSDSCESRDLLFEQNADYWDKETIALKYLKLKELAEENSVELVSPPIQDGLQQVLSGDINETTHADPSHLVLDAKMVREQAEAIDKSIILPKMEKLEVCSKLVESNISFDDKLLHRHLVALLKREIKKNHPIRIIITKVNLKTILHLYHSVLEITTRHNRTHMENRITNWCFQHFPKSPIEGLGITIENASKKTAVVDNLVTSDEPDTTEVNSEAADVEIVSHQIQDDGLQLKFTGNVQDQSVVVAEKTRDLVIMRLEKLQVPHDKTQDVKRLKSTLKAYLKEKHPLHTHLRKLKPQERIVIFRISCPKSKCDKIPQLNAQIARYCFDKFPHSPLGEGLPYLVKKAEQAAIAADQEPTIVLTEEVGESMDTTDQEPTIVLPLVNPVQVLSGDNNNEGQQSSSNNERTVVDESVMVDDDMSRLSVIERLRNIKELTFKPNCRIGRLQKLLEKHLRIIHPLHAQLRDLSPVKLTTLYQHINPTPLKLVKTHRMHSFVAKFVFDNYPKDPIAGLHSIFQDIERIQLTQPVPQPMECGDTQPRQDGRQVKKKAPRKTNKSPRKRKKTSLWPRQSVEDLITDYETLLARVKEIRREGLRKLNEGKSNVSDLSPDNPLLQGGQVCKGRS
jgi:hypothetical protein